MGSTNKTTNLQLPQWIGTDKPTFLGDFNDAFLKIDEGYGTISGNATTAIAQAGQAVQTANNANTAATTAQETAETADNKASTASSTANSALEVANNANSSVSTVSTRVTSLETQFADFSTWVSGSLSNIPSSWTARGNMVNYNNDLSLLNITLRITGSQNIQSGITIGTLPTNIVSQLSLTGNRTIYGGCGVYFTSGGSPIYTNLDLTIDTSGNIQTAETVISTPASQITCNLMLCVFQW